jgi:hypothetical protein
MSRKCKIGYYFLGEEAWGFRPASRTAAPLRGPAVRRDARLAAERRAHAYRPSTGNVEEPPELS